MTGLRDGVAVVRATAADAPGIARLHGVVHDLHVEHRPGFFRPIGMARLREIAGKVVGDRDLLVFVARAGDDVVGYAIGSRDAYDDIDGIRDASYLYIDQIAVDPARRREGTGRRLVEKLVAAAAGEGIERVVLDTWAFNEGAHRFFEAVGFETEILRLGLDPREDADEKGNR